MAKAEPKDSPAPRTRPRPASAEEIRLAALRRDARRPKGELLDEAMTLSRAVVEMAAAGKRARR